MCYTKVMVVTTIKSECNEPRLYYGERLTVSIRTDNLVNTLWASVYLGEWKLALRLKCNAKMVIKTWGV